MEPKITHHIDKSEQDENGLYAFYYEYDLYEFCENELCFIARSYTDEPNEVHFLRKEVFGKSSLMTKDDLKHSILMNAKKYFLSKGKTSTNYLSQKGYEPL